MFLKAYTVGVRVLNPGGRPPEQQPQKSLSNQSGFVDTAVYWLDLIRATNYWGISLQDAWIWIMRVDRQQVTSTSLSVLDKGTKPQKQLPTVVVH